MGKHVRSWDETKYRKYLKQERGQGEGEAYTPWVSVQDFSSKGTISRVLGWKTNRVHHFMSNNELRYFYQLEWSDSILDIREQFPLLDIEKTMSIAKEAGIKHPIDSQSGFPYVLTTDFLITTADGLFARTVKQSGELQNRRILEKLEIERRYWISKGVDWRIITEQEIALQKTYNIEWLHNSKILSGLYLDSVLLSNVLLEIRRLYEGTNWPVLSFCERLDCRYDIPAGGSLRLFKHLAANKFIDIGIDAKLNLSYQRSNIFAEALTV